MAETVRFTLFTLQIGPHTSIEKPKDKPHFFSLNSRLPVSLHKSFGSSSTLESTDRIDRNERRSNDDVSSPTEGDKEAYRERRLQRHFGEFVTVEFRKNHKLSDQSSIQQKLTLAKNYTYLLNSVHHPKGLLFSYNIAVDRSEEIRRVLGKSAASVGLRLPEVSQP